MVLRVFLIQDFMPTNVLLFAAGEHLWACVGAGVLRSGDEGEAKVSAAAANPDKPPPRGTSMELARDGGRTSDMWSCILYTTDAADELTRVLVGCWW